MKIHVSELECAGHGRCNLVNAELYPLDDAGFAAIEDVDVSPGLEADARAGAQACPALAITITDDV